MFSGNSKGGILVHLSDQCDRDTDVIKKNRLQRARQVGEISLLTDYFQQPMKPIKMSQELRTQISDVDESFVSTADNRSIRRIWFTYPLSHHCSSSSDFVDNNHPSV